MAQAVTLLLSILEMSLSTLGQYRLSWRRVSALTLCRCSHVYRCSHNSTFPHALQITTHPHSKSLPTLQHCWLLTVSTGPMSCTHRATPTASNHEYLNRPKFVKETQCVFCNVETEGLISGFIESQCVNDTAVPFCEIISDFSYPVNVNKN
jgi:hypothetical protein